MSINTVIYDRLNDASITTIVSTRIYPTDAQENTPLPCLIYTPIDSDPQISLDGRTDLAKYTVQIDSFSRSLAESQSLVEAINSRLHGYTGGFIQGSFLTDSQQEEIGDESEGDIYHRIQSFEVWLSEANITSTVDSTGQIATSLNTVTLTACNHTLTLSCDGLKLDGQSITSGGGGGGSESTFVYNQNSPATVWHINHNLDNFPSVTVIDSGGNVVFGDVQYVDANNITLTFSVAFGGKAYLNA